PPRLDAHLGQPVEAELLRRGGDHRADAADHVGRLHRRVLRRIAHAEPAARRYLTQRDAPLLTHLLREGEETLDLGLIRLDLVDLRADVCVIAAEIERRLLKDRAHALSRGARLDAQAEFRVEIARREMRVRVRVDAGRDPEQDRGPDPALHREPGEEADLVEVVHDDAPDALREREAQLVLALVVAVEVDALAGEVDLRTDEELAGGDDVEADALVGEERQDQGRGVGLRGVADDRRAGVAAREGVTIAAGPRENARLIEDIERRAVARREVSHVAAAHNEMAAVDPRRVREDVAGRDNGNAQGFSSTSNRTPCASTTCVPKFTVLVCRRIYPFHASDPAWRPPPVSFSPPKAPPISAPLVPAFTFASPVSAPAAESQRSAACRSRVKMALERPCGTALFSAIASSSVSTSKTC